LSRHLEGQVAIITGASSGIGRALARELSAEGARVALVARRVRDLESLAGEIVAGGGQALAIPGDVTAPDDMAHAAQAVLDSWGRIDILVANAGIYVQGMTADLTVANLERAMDVNFFGAVRAVYAVLPAMRAQRRGHLVFMSTQDVMIPIPGDGPYVASKSALTGLAQTLRQELKPDGIRVTVIHPGRIDTPLIEHLRMPLASPKVPAEGLARCTVRSIIRGRRRLIYPASGYLCMLRDLWPALGDWLIGALRLQGWPTTHMDEGARKDLDD
jgi:NAD(P)-dependent dehydrogenase (short-subunit alcohol dehydrogenase family)